MIHKIVVRLIIWYMSRVYKKAGTPIYEIVGDGKYYPKYLMYTENEYVRDRLKRI